MRFHLSVDAIVKDDEGVLLIKRAIEPFKGKWVLPGGSLEKDEIMIDAIKREVKEETGLDVDVKKYMGYYDDPKRNPNKRSITHVFICKPRGGKIRNSFESTEIKFFKKIPRGLGFDHRKILRDAGFR